MAHQRAITQETTVSNQAQGSATASTCHRVTAISKLPTQKSRKKNAHPAVPASTTVLKLAPNCAAINQYISTVSSTSKVSHRPNIKNTGKFIGATPGSMGKASRVIGMTNTKASRNNKLMNF
jgi:hypothetical protein